MNARLLLKNWSSLTAAAAALLLGSPHRAAASKSVPETGAPKFGDGDPFEPLILKPPAVKIIPGERFAGHQSHASHASHASHYSGSSDYQNPAATPAYANPSPVSTATPNSFAPSQTGVSASRIEFANGAIYYGTILTKSSAGITIRGVDGKTYKVQRKLLSALTIAELGLPGEEPSAGVGQAASGTQSKDAAVLKQKNEELEQTISALQADNEALRKQIQATDSTSKSVGQPRAAQTASDANTKAQDTPQAYWLSGTGKRHNKNCRYYGTGKGHPCGPNDGVPCKICGG